METRRPLVGVLSIVLSLIILAPAIMLIAVLIFVGLTVEGPIDPQKVLITLASACLLVLLSMSVLAISAAISLSEIFVPDKYKLNQESVSNR